MFNIGDKVRVKNGKFKDYTGVIIDINFEYFPPITVEIKNSKEQFLRAFFYENNLEKLLTNSK
jgi:hypothetical protein